MNEIDILPVAMLRLQFLKEFDCSFQVFENVSFYSTSLMPCEVCIFQASVEFQEHLCELPDEPPAAHPSIGSHEIFDEIFYTTPPLMPFRPAQRLS